MPDTTTATIMSEEAARTVLRSAAPGQFDAVAESVQQFGQKALASNITWLTEVENELKEFRCEEGVLEKNTEHPTAKALHELMEDYQQTNFLSKPGITARMALTKGDGEKSELLVHTYAEKIDTPNQYAGNWKATWTIHQTEKSMSKISGDVVVQSYAHEDGNVQLRIHKKFPPVVVGKASPKEGEEASVAGGIVQEITKWETIVLGILESLNDSVSTDHLKLIRRVLPITKTKMNWDVVAHRGVKTLKQTAPEARSKVKYNN